MIAGNQISHFNSFRLVILKTLIFPEINVIVYCKPDSTTSEAFNEIIAAIAEGVFLLWKHSYRNEWNIRVALIKTLFKTSITGHKVKKIIEASDRYLDELKGVTLKNKTQSTKKKLLENWHLWFLFNDRFACRCCYAFNNLNDKISHSLNTFPPSTEL